jgi:16S rRNA C967 or C1407 C5-methylase (RsmB/RsmF family)/NOL1/NOP2/fmu family ribosome biogenesis protein
VQLPEAFLKSLHGIEGFDEKTFVQVHQQLQNLTSIRINPAKPFDLDEESQRLHLAEKTGWAKNGFYLSQRPSFTFDPLFHAGCYYVQEASSMFLEQAFTQLLDLSETLRVLDLSAAPGGKSTHIQSLISAASLLVSNEVIRARANILQDNIIRWGCENVIVSNNDPRDFSRLENFFDVLVVDAPCSGSGLFKKDEAAVEQWSPELVELCSQRQQRILADAWPSLKRNGLLIYSTCSYSKEEDEEIIEWLKKEFSIETCRLQLNDEWGIVEVESQNFYGYRFWPGKAKGEGFFLSCMRKTDGEEKTKPDAKNKTEMISEKENAIVKKWMSAERPLIKEKEGIVALPQSLVGDIQFLKTKLRIHYSGTHIGALIREKLIPDHALAMSGLCSDEITKFEVNERDAIKYLQKKEMGIKGEKQGWQLVSYKGHSLGWANVLPTRINNYYPKSLRILSSNWP